MDSNKIKFKIFFWYAVLWFFLFITLYCAYGVYFPDLSSTKSKWVALLSGAIALLLSSCKICEISYANYKYNTLSKIIEYFYNGVQLFFKRENKFLIFITFLIAVILLKPLGIPFVLCYLIGTLFAIFCGFITNYISTRAVVKISRGENTSLNSGFKIAFNSGVAIAMAIVGLALVPMVILYHIYKDYLIINGFILGVAISVLFSSVAASITKKAATGAIELVSQSEDDIEAYDKRNPLLLLSGIAKSVFKTNALSLDMFLSFCSAIISSMAIGAMALNLMGAFLPLIIASGGVFSSVIVILFIKMNKIKNPINALFVSGFCTIILFCIFSYYAINTWLMGDLGLFYSVVIGAFGGFILCFVNANYIFEKFKTVKNVSNAAIAGLSPCIVQTLKEGFMGVFLPIIVIAFMIISSFLLANGIDAPLVGIYGITMAILGMISTFGIMMCINIFALVSNDIDIVTNTYEIGKEFDKNKNIKMLGQIGYYIISLGKNFLATTAILTALSLFLAFSVTVQLEQIDIVNPYVLASLFIGAALPYLYCSFILSGVSKTSSKLILEVKNQFRKFPQILRYEMRPDYEKCVCMAANTSSIQLIFYTMMIVFVFLTIALKLGAEALAGLVFGTVLSSSVLMYASLNSAIVSKAAKKYFKDEFINAPISNQYSILEQNNSIYSLLKDLITPCLSSLIKFLAILAFVLSPMFLK